MELEEQVRQLVNNKIKGTPFFIVEIKVSHKSEIKVYLDGDEGIDIDKCAEVNRYLQNKLQKEEGLNYSILVSSPGIHEPLKLPRQYKKNVGRDIRVKLLNGIRKTGTLLSVNEEGIILRERQSKKEKKKNKPVKESSILFNDIKTTKVILKI